MHVVRELDSGAELLLVTNVADSCGLQSLNYHGGGVDPGRGSVAVRGSEVLVVVHDLRR